MKTYRYEQKYLLNPAQYKELVPVISALLPRDPHGDGDGEYMVRSLYFDDPAMSAFTQKESGIYARKKYRIRVYNVSRQVIHLECKYKQGAYIAKETAALTLEEYLRIREGDWGFLLKRKEPAAREFALDCAGRMLKPQVIVDYEREPYVLEAGTVRITFDKNVRAVRREEDLFDREVPAYSVLPSGQMIMEIKFTGYLPERAARIFQVRNLPQTPASKYCLCLQQLKALCR